MSKLIGIIYSPSFGAGWSSWGKPKMAIDQELAIAIDQGRPRDEILKIAEKNWPNEYMGGLDGCKVEWVEHGTQFMIEEYDGNERIVYRGDNDLWTTAQ